MAEAQTPNQPYKEIKFRAITPEVSLPWDSGRIRVIEIELRDGTTRSELDTTEVALINLRGSSLPRYVEAQRMFVMNSMTEIDQMPTEELGSPEGTKKAIEAAYEITLRKLQDRGMIEILPDEAT